MLYSSCCEPHICTHTFALRVLGRKHHVAWLWTMPESHRVDPLFTACQQTCPSGSCKPTTDVSLFLFCLSTGRAICKGGSWSNFQQAAGECECVCVFETKREEANPPGTTRQGLYLYNSLVAYQVIRAGAPVLPHCRTRHLLQIAFTQHTFSCPLYAPPLG